MLQSLASNWSALTSCPPSNRHARGDEKLGCLVLGRGEKVMRPGHALFSWPGAAVRPDLRMLCHGRRLIRISISALHRDLFLRVNPSQTKAGGGIRSRFRACSAAEVM
jgi:hypothetical protein